MSVYDRVETENPLLDEILYNAKLMIKTCILKNEYEADNAETKQSKINGDRYLLACEKRCTYIMFDDYQTSDFRDAGILNNNMINHYLNHPDDIDKNLQKRLAKARSERLIREYEEENPYYRNICGLPPLGEEGVYLTPEDCKDSRISDIDYSIPLHKMNEALIKLLHSKGIIDKVAKKYPKKYYIKNIYKFISPYVARKANNYSLIYVDTEGIEPVLVDRFKDLIEENRPYFIRTMVDDGYRMYNEYYDRFIIMMIVAQTLCDMVNEIPDYYIRRDVFDIRTCEYFMEANGVKFFSEIPLTYQKKMVQDINLLCKYKSSNSNIKHIMKIFGQKNINIYQYYLQKVRRKKDGQYITTGALEDQYDLQFIKVPLDGGEVDDYSKSPNNIVDYAAITSGDKYWTGPYDKSEVKHGILEQDFSIIKSKYMSVDATVSLTELTFQVAYFTNMVMYSSLNLDQVLVYIPLVGNCRLFDLFCYIYALTYLYYGRSDDILYDMSSVLTCRGFNFDADLTELSEFIANKGYTLEDLGVSGFELPKSGVLSLSQMMSIFINNRKIYDFVQEQMYKSNDKDEYDCYKKIYDALFITEINYKNFYIEELGRVAESYTEYLQYSDDSLYSSLMEAKKMYREESDNDEMKKHIFKKLESAISSLSKFSEELSMVFYDTPTNSLNVMISYITKVINFFKSFKVTILGLQDLYYLEQDHMYIIDDMTIFYILSKNDYYHINDYIGVTTLLNKKINIDIMDNIIKVPHFAIHEHLDFDDRSNSYIKDIMHILVSLTKRNNIDIYDLIKLLVYKFPYDKVSYKDNLFDIADSITRLVMLSKKDEYDINDKAYVKGFEFVYNKILYKDNLFDIADKIDRFILMAKKDIYEIRNEVHIDEFIHVDDKLTYEDNLFDIADKINRLILMTKKDYYDINSEAHIDEFIHVDDKLTYDDTVNDIFDNIVRLILLAKKDEYTIKSDIHIDEFIHVDDKLTYEDISNNIRDGIRKLILLSKKDYHNITSDAHIDQFMHIDDKLSYKDKVCNIMDRIKALLLLQKNDYYSITSDAHIDEFMHIDDKLSYEDEVCNIMDRIKTLLLLQKNDSYTIKSDAHIDEFIHVDDKLTYDDTVFNILETIVRSILIQKKDYYNITSDAHIDEFIHVDDKLSYEDTVCNILDELITNILISKNDRYDIKSDANINEFIRIDDKVSYSDKYNIMDDKAILNILLSKKDEQYIINDGYSIAYRTINRINSVLNDVYTILNDKAVINILLAKRDEKYDIKDTCNVASFIKRHTKSVLNDVYNIINDRAVINTLLVKRDEPYIIRDDYNIDYFYLKNDKSILNDSYDIFDDKAIINILTEKHDIYEIINNIIIHSYNAINRNITYTDRYDNISDHAIISTLLNMRDSINITDKVVIKEYYKV